MTRFEAISSARHADERTCFWRVDCKSQLRIISENVSRKNKSAPENPGRSLLETAP
jgi:hypothetical protein